MTCGRRGLSSLRAKTLARIGELYRLGAAAGTPVDPRFVNGQALTDVGVRCLMCRLQIALGESEPWPEPPVELPATVREVKKTVEMREYRAI